MPDIVDHLLDYACGEIPTEDCTAQRRQAAAEIKRLRARVRFLEVMGPAVPKKAGGDNE